MPQVQEPSVADPANPTPTNPSPSPAPNPSASSAPAQGGGSDLTPTRPDYVPETFWDATTNTVKTAEFTTHIGELAALKAQQDARLAALPKDAAGYEFKLPADFKAPDGWALDEKHTLLAPWRAYAHKHQLSQDQFSAGVQMMAEAQIASNAASKAAYDAELKKLGATATMRVTASQTWLSSIVGAEQASRLLGLLETAGDFEAIEKLQLASSNQGAARPNGNGREPPAPPPKRRENILYPNLPAKGS